MVIDEVWVPIPGYEGYYEVSSLGRVRSVDRIIACADGRTRSFRSKIRKATTSKADGYVRISLSVRGESSTQTIHALVASCFIGPRPVGQDVCHINGCRDDNRSKNLKYGTRSENEQDKLIHGTHAHANKTHCPRNHKLSEPNLVRSALRKGRRDCLACARARAYIHEYPSHDFVSVADSRYRDIMINQVV